jgi:hypothetical protein
MRKASRWFAFASIALSGLSLVGCSASPPPEHGETPVRMSLCLTSGIGLLGYAYDEVLAKRAALGELRCALELTERDVDRYVVDETPQGNVDLVLSEDASRRVAPNPTADVCQEGLFEMRLDGVALYAGQCYPAMGAAALGYPVIHVRPEGNRIVLEVRAQQMPARPDETAAKRIDPEPLRALFAKTGKTALRH